MALISSLSTLDSTKTACVATLKYSHQLSGFCSAQPNRTDKMGASFFGYNAEATHLSLSASTRLAFTDELPMSYPNKYMAVPIYCNFCFSSLHSSATYKIHDPDILYIAFQIYRTNICFFLSHALKSLNLFPFGNLWNRIQPSIYIGN